MKNQFYFKSEDSEICYNESQFQEQMRLDNVKEMEVYKAESFKNSGSFWCKSDCFCGDDSSDYCGKQCESYAPRNGKSGCCKYYTATLYIPGEKVVLKSKTLNDE